MNSVSLAPDSHVADVSVSVWRAPLVPAALAVTAGIVFDRYLSPPLLVSLAVAAVSLLAAFISLVGNARGLPLVYLALAGMALGAVRYHYHRNVFASDDIGNWCMPEPRPLTVRGQLDDEPVRSPAIAGDPLRSRDRPESAVAPLRVTALRDHGDWQPTSGLVRLAGTPLDGLHAGDFIEVVGRLGPIPGPANPGEFDQSAFWQDRGVRAQLAVRPTADVVTRLQRGWPGSVTGCLAVVRGWGQQVLVDHLPPRTAGLAAALLLGDGAPLAASDWEKYLRTGVIHVLAISGQHLVVFGAMLWWVLKKCGVRQRHAAAIVAVVLFAYALLTGGRPPALRAAVMVGATCAAMLFRRRTMPANAFALAWLVVALANPADLFTAGCQLSFLAVAVLSLGTHRLFKLNFSMPAGTTVTRLSWSQRFFNPDLDPLQKLIEESRPGWQRLLLNFTRWLVEAYVVAALVWLAVAPLAAARYHVIPGVGFLLGVPLDLLTSVALVAGALVLLSAALALPLVSFLVPFVHGPLLACDELVEAGDRLPGGHVYVGNIPDWWLAVFYLGLLAVLTQARWRRSWRWAATAGLGWLCVGLMGAAARLPSDEFRVTFLAVGHGGCTVLEAPDGRTLLYDAGAIAGPDVARRQIAPFLWHRGIRRIDEVFLSHADLDHFNGVPDLLSRFSVGQVTLTPTFADKSSPAVVHTLAVLAERRVPTRIVHAGQHLAAGPVFLEILHPPEEGPAGNENARSLVLRVTYGSHSILLTGDLEAAGLERVLRLSPSPVDVLMAPHHGSRKANPADLARWARPRVVISCQGPPLGWREKPEVYSVTGAHYLATWPDGAITIRSHTGGLVVDTFVSREFFVVRGAGPGG